MNLEINIPEEVERKLKAWAILTRRNPKQVEDMVVSLLGSVLSQEIAAALKQPLEGYAGVSPSSQESADETFSLGETEEEEEEDRGSREESFQAFVPDKGGLSDKDIESDMEVEDPEHEAVSDGSDGGGSFEDMFSSSLNKQSSAPEPRDPGILRREQLKQAQRGKRRAKVSGLTSIPKE